jgi:hypothetical protein
MPSKSAKQHRAMQAAAHGASNIGIPKDVGQEFLKADKKRRKPKQWDLPKQRRAKQ